VIAHGGVPVLETLGQMTVNILERSGLDLETCALLRIAALVAMDAAPVSYLLNVALASEVGIALEKVHGTLVDIGPCRRRRAHRLSGEQNAARAWTGRKFSRTRRRTTMMRKSSVCGLVGSAVHRVAERRVAVCWW